MEVSQSNKVMHIVSGLHIGGAEMMLYRLLTHTRMENSVVVSLSKDGELAENIRKLGVDVIELQRGSLIDTFKQICQLVEQYKPTVLQSWLYRADLLAGLVGWRKKVPVIWNVRQTEVGKVKTQGHIWWIQRVNALLSRLLPTCIIYCADAAQKSHQTIAYSAKKAVVISNGIDTEKLAFDESLRRSQRKSWGIYNDEMVIGMMGRFDPLKNHQRFLRVIKQVIDLCPKYKVKAVLVGRGINKNNKQLMQIIQSYQLSDQVLLVDEVANVVPVYSAMDIHLLTSDNEGWPNVLAEAMSIGLPCVTTDVGDARLMVADTSTVIHKDNEAKYIEKVVEYVHLSSSERWKLAKLNREKIQQNSSLQSTVNRYDELYSGFNKNN